MSLRAALEALRADRASLDAQAARLDELIASVQALITDDAPPAEPAGLPAVETSPSQADTKKGRRYSEEQKNDALALGDRLGSDWQAERQLGFGNGTIGRWRAQGFGKPAPAPAKPPEPEPVRIAPTNAAQPAAWVPSGVKTPVNRDQAIAAAYGEPDNVEAVAR